MKIIFIGIILLLLCECKIDSAKNRVFSLNKGYSVILPDDWKNLNNKDVFQLSSNDDKIVLSATLIKLFGDNFNDFCKIRYSAVDLKIWQYNGNIKLKFKSKYNIITNVYEGININSYYIVNCIEYKNNNYLSLTYVVDKDAYEKNIKVMEKIINSLKFYVK